MFYLLKRSSDDEPLEFYASRDDKTVAIDAAKQLCQAGFTVVVAEAVVEVKVAPVVVELRQPPPIPTVVYRNAPVNSQEPDPETTARVPQARPRLLISKDRPPTEDYMKHLMVVAEGRIVKNAFGALELDDMPLTAEERALVLEALKVT